MHNSVQLITLTLGLWLLLVWPAYLIGGKSGVEGITYAGLLCLLPGLLAFVMQAQLRLITTDSKLQPVYAVLAATGLRLVFVLGGVLLIRNARPALGFGNFMVWVVVFYLAALIYETRTTLRQVSA